MCCCDCSLVTKRWWAEATIDECRGLWTLGIDTGDVQQLTHWGRVTHICISGLTIIGSDNGLSPGQREVIIWTDAGILLIWTLGTNFSEIFSKIRTFSFKKIHLKMSSAKLQQFCLSFNMLNALKPEQNVWHFFGDDIFRYNFLYVIIVYSYIEFHCSFFPKS